jgi:subtilisin-like proprotein convertase family protein
LAPGQAPPPLFSIPREQTTIEASTLPRKEASLITALEPSFTTKQAARQAHATEPPPFTLTNELMFFLAPGADVDAVARDLKVQALYPLTGQSDIWVFRAESVDAATKARAVAALDPRVAGAFFNRKIHLSKCYVPNDPYYQGAGVPPGFPGQWHLPRANLPTVWANDPTTGTGEVTGAGVLLAIEDDGLEFTHPDLAGNFNAANSANFGVFPPDSNYGPNTAYDGQDDLENRHGTAVGGVAAAVGGNGVGVTGAAPFAGLAINRIPFDNTQTDAMVDNAVGFNANTNNNSIKVKNHSYGLPAPYVDNSGESLAVNSSAAAGTLHSYAAGNYRGTFAQDSNKIQAQNNPNIICVAALGSDDKYAYYSNFGACVFVTAPSSSGTGTYGILTTDRTLGGVGQLVGYNPIFQHADPTTIPPTLEVDDAFPDHSYTSLFGGTSSASPLVAGILALGKQANPGMNIRLAQHCLARTSSVVDATDSTLQGGGDGSTAGSAWITNAASPTPFHFNQNYGFGVINANLFVKEAVKYTGVTEVGPAVHSESFAPISIPDYNGTSLNPVTRNFVVNYAGALPLEAIQVTLNITHPFRGDITATLTSPSGTVCRLMVPSGLDDGTFPDPFWSFPNWTFTTYAFWGEPLTVGTNPWTISVADAGAADTGTWNGFTFSASMGQPIPDTTPPHVVSITRAQPTPTNVNPLTFNVKFSEYVTGVDATDFVLTTTGSITGASITGVKGGCDSYVVTVNPGNGAGTIRLDHVDNDSIADGAGNKLGGTGVVGSAGDGSYALGQHYDYDNVPPTISVTSTSPDGGYTLNNQINITLQFSKALTLAGGNLQVTLDTGAVLTILPFSNKSSVSATYTVTAGQFSPDLTAQSPVVLLAGATLTDIYGNNCTLGISPANNLAATHAIVVDADPPRFGVVVDGFSGAELTDQTSITTIAAHWSGWVETGTGIAGYRWAIGTTAGSANVMPYTDVGLATAVTTSFLNINLHLTRGTKYFVTVEARDGIGNKGIAASPGITIDPAIPGGSDIIPLPPARLDALASSNQITLVWPSSPTPGVTGYRLWYKKTSDPWTAAQLVDNIPVPVAPATPSVVVTPLTLGQSYDFQIRTLLTTNESSSVYTSGTPTNLITINGAGNYATIGAAVTAATAGDTITIQAGMYTESLTLNKAIVLKGVSPKFTIITSGSAAFDDVVLTGAGPASLSQLTITGGGIGVNAGTTPVTLQNVIIHHTAGDGVSSTDTGSGLQVLSCTIAHNGAMGIDSAGSATVRDVIATGNATYGISVASAAGVTYNDSYANGTMKDYSSNVSLATNISTPVKFTDEPNNDYTEQTGSISIDSGSPADAFTNEPDYNGGRINLGAYGNTSFAATSPLPTGGGGGGGGGCGLTGLESVLLLALLRRRSPKT